jgi:hypothetical protein
MNLLVVFLVIALLSAAGAVYFGLRQAALAQRRLTALNHLVRMPSSAARCRHRKWPPNYGKRALRWMRTATHCSALMPNGRRQ